MLYLLQDVMRARRYDQSPLVSLLAPTASYASSDSGGRYPPSTPQLVSNGLGPPVAFSGRISVPLSISKRYPMEARKPYAAPVLLEYGSVSDLTRLSDRPNADTPGGTDGTAYSA